MWHPTCSVPSAATGDTGSSGLAVCTLFGLVWPPCVCVTAAPPWVSMEQLPLPRSICWLLSKISPDVHGILCYHKVSAWIWALILHSVALFQAGWGSAFPSETTTDSSPLREREERGSGCISRVRKGCLRPWGSCRAGEDDQESLFSFSGWDGEVDVSPLPAVTNMRG